MHLNDWVKNVSRIAVQKFAEQCGALLGEGTEHVPANVTISFTDEASLDLSEMKVVIKEIRFEGVLERTVRRMPSELKALVKLGESRPVAGCCISDFGEFFAH